MEQFKGIGKTAISCQTDQQDNIELIRFADGSWGVRKNAETVGVWEPHEEQECFCVFSMLAGLHEARQAGSTIIILRKRAAVMAATAARASIN
ncbi:MAG: hypothetical protein JWN40_3655 [Phycisphaerales bacterium]|jgi:hypothetical protein|nr:hypothetical protein [Phycisphaerales bacterium]